MNANDAHQSPYHAIKTQRRDSSLGKGDFLVLFGELFQKGYANGLVEEAQNRQMTLVRSTVGRRDKEGKLRPLNPEEFENIPAPFINIPLEAGFDLEPDAQGLTPVEQLRQVKLSEWEACQMDKASWQESQKLGRERMTAQIRTYVAELSKIIDPTKNVVFAHLMAGGVPRAKIILPLMNRSLKGSGDRFLSSERFFKSSIGQFVVQSFFEVSAETFALLVHETVELRKKIKNAGGKVSYTAYGYHGTEVLVGNNYLWQTYTPYLQGWAKLRLEAYAREFSSKGIAACVYNCPEILTQSSSIFTGVEMPLYSLLGALKKENSEHPKTKKAIDDCLALLKPEYSLNDVLQTTQKYLMSDLIRQHCDYDKWPQHNQQDQLEKMTQTSEQLFNMHKNSKNLINSSLSEIVISACGRIMINDCVHPESPTSWINHDIIAQSYLGS